MSVANQQFVADTSPFLLHLNSLQRITGSPSSFRIQLSFPVLYCNSVRLLAASIPNAFYVFNTTNTRGVRVNNYINFIDSTGLENTAQITPGTYDINSLMTEIKTQMEAVSVDTYTLTYNTNTLKLTISSTSALFNLLWLTGTNTSQNCYYELGWNLADSGVGAVQLSPRSIAIGGPLNIFLQCQQFRNVLHDSRSFTANFCIPMDVEYGQYKYFKENSEFDTKIPLQNFKNVTFLDFSLTSEFGSVYLDSDWSALFKFE